MLRIRFTKNEGCDITAKPAELRAVGEVIQRLASAGHGFHSFSGDTSLPPEPYDRILSQLTIRVASGPVCATVDGDTLTIEAGPEFLAPPFASFFNFDDDTPAGHHHHHEYFEGNDYISPKSVPLAIGVGGRIDSRPPSQ